MLRDLVPSFLYGAGSQSAAPSSAAAVSAAASSSSTMMATSTPLLSSSPSSFQQRRAPVVAFAPSEAKIELYSPKYYGVCAVGGALCCGLTHTAVTPLDVVKCNMQTNPAKYPGIAAGFGVTAREGGARGLVRGWVPTLIGYSIQGAAKFGLYEYFKK
jgi:solute carrier family 25 phosphate transporter 3